MAYRSFSCDVDQRILNFEAWRYDTDPRLCLSKNRLMSVSRTRREEVTQLKLPVALKVSINVRFVE